MVKVYDFKKNKKTGYIRFKHAEVIEKDGPGADSTDTEGQLSEVDEL
jgi:hypothetical protein